MHEKNKKITIIYTELKSMLGDIKIFNVLLYICYENEVKCNSDNI